MTYLLSGGRDEDSARLFMRGPAGRLKEQPLLATDALPAYSEAVASVFSRFGAKHVGKSRTSYVERLNLTIRMDNRRFTPRTNGFSKKFECHAAHLHVQLLHYNFCRVHGT